MSICFFTADGHNIYYVENNHNTNDIDYFFITIPMSSPVMTVIVMMIMMMTIMIINVVQPVGILFRYVFAFKFMLLYMFWY